MGDKLDIVDSIVETDTNCMDVDLYPPSVAEETGHLIEQATLNPDAICLPSDVLSHDNAEVELELETALKKKCQIQLNSNNIDNNNEDMIDPNDNMNVDAPSQNVCDDKGEWNDISLSDEDIEKIVDTQPRIMPNRQQLLKARHWMEYLEDKLVPWNSRYRCKICHGYSQFYHVQDYMMPELGKPNGVLKNTKAENVYQIARHEKSSKVHQKLLQMRKEEKKFQLENEISGLITDKFTDQFSYAVTNRHIRLVMASAIMGLSFNMYPTMASKNVLISLLPYVWIILS